MTLSRFRTAMSFSTLSTAMGIRLRSFSRVLSIRWSKFNTDCAPFSSDEDPRSNVDESTGDVLGTEVSEKGKKNGNLKTIF